ncbi:tRNA pseudouridine(55) synthase TruB [Candidatus Saccharibacteria bacterium RIFCSPHIGHO2_12_FULL_49_19]|nr:MAG: tRNA pseudouridine(55) synthase TruB [Candidatus Saccharibacteria bacterium RIFCSPHIGHO2_01_FULL_49_21]OGL36486.1 MAG: tRNA pseudouridine(55) synthase TruB [Candidatus Saccharibacteria bacterium RIFCSPHIGHO2_12_FULL_49_19]OGL38221.1 MAG: tRNA pseudouridine(55) synthase TruB [Candidatus Saccharibacteria bacterium RIFCSPLOWO2_01_FULL_49_22]
MDGILLVDKPAGWTSHDVVAKVRRILRHQVDGGQFVVDSEKLKTKTYKLKPIKVGHTGTLDPFATGLLVLVVGSYTKRAQEFSKLDKTYEAEITLGATSTTGDIEGEITPKSGQKPTEMAIREVLGQFEGQIEQTPHAYSAVKIGGQRAYKLARQGKEVKLEPRQVKVYRLEVLGYGYPKLKIVTEVSSGTYVRSLAGDIGEKLGTGAYLSALRRTEVGQYSVNQAVSLDSDLLEHLAK